MDIRDYVDEIVQKEWKMFGSVQNIGGRADCQDNYQTFRIMRYAQFQAWSAMALESYLNDLKQGEKDGRNLLSEKYAYMMEYTDPERYARVEHILPITTSRQKQLIDNIMKIYLDEAEEFMNNFSGMRQITRNVYETESIPESFASIETYARGEFKTYSENTLRCFLTHLQNLRESGVSYVKTVYENVAKMCGYKNIEELNSAI